MAAAAPGKGRQGSGTLALCTPGSGLGSPPGSWGAQLAPGVPRVLWRGLTQMGLSVWGHRGRAVPPAIPAAPRRLLPHPPQRCLPF